MNEHQPFRDWIFEEEPLPGEDRRNLQSHLRQCADCRMLAERWNAAKASLQEAGMAEPRAGFPGRWKALARARLREPSRRAAWVLLAASGLGSLVMGAALALQTPATGLSLAGVFTRDLTAAAGTVGEWLGASRAFGEVLAIISRSIPPAVYLLAVFLLSLIGVLALLVFVRLHPRGEGK
jgi:anti-sigma factor RsiW